MSAKTLNGSFPETTVKRLLRHRGSREFFKNGGWTTNPEEADSFSDVVQVAETCARFSLIDVELTLRLQPQASDVFCIQIR